jgi:hypothetical protein
MIGIIIAAIIAIIVIGLVFKLAKVAIILALVFGGVVLVRNFIGQKRIK